ncbi:MAG: protein kinase [Acidobacteriaceae bacterium]|nr:protein kinase [Acidobacteriaceae bacterium]
MTDEQWRLAWKAYAAAADVPHEERQSILAAYEIEPEVLKAVASMLEEAQTDLDAPLPSTGSRNGTRFGRYEIGELLGSGGMGEVYAADDPELTRKVAIKFLNGEIAIGSRPVERLMREARAASALNHPHIVTVYELVRENDEVAIAMELVEGYSVRHFCGNPQKVAHILLWGQQIAQALAAAHARKIIHRDIKPENLMVREDGILKVLDFGIAGQWDTEGKKGSGRLSGSGGTLDYMSPEQVRGEQATGASDVFSLAVVLYELATGTHPFRSASAIDTLRAVSEVDPRPLSSFDRTLPVGLETLLIRMLSKEPGNRPSASEVQRQLSLAAARKRGWHARFTVWTAAVLALIAIAISATYIFRDRLSSAKEPQLLQLTRQVNENRVTAAAISADGKTLLFTTLSGALYRRRTSDGLTQPLNTPRGLRVDRIAWFKDGSKIMLEGSMIGAPDEYEPSIWVMPAAGGKPEQVATGKNGVPSPDGTWIAFTSTDESILSVISVTGGNRNEIRNGGDTVSFTSLFWSPDGKRIAFQRVEYGTGDLASSPNAFLALNTYHHEYESVNVDSGQSVFSAKHFVMESAYGLDDGSILFLRNTPEKSLVYDLWRVRTDPHTGRLLNSPQQLTHGDYNLRQISASPDGKEIVAVRDVDSHPNIYLADLPPTDQYPRFSRIRRLTFSDADDFPHAWTPDSRLLIFESTRNGNSDLFRQEIDGSEAQPLVVSNRFKALPRITPDGKWIFYNEQTPTNRWNLMGFPIEGGPAKIFLANQPVQGEFACALGTAGRCVTRAVQNGQFLFRDLNPDGGAGRELAKTAWSPAVVGDWDISPDGSQVAIPDHDPRKATIRLVPLDARAGASEKVVTIRTLKNLSGVVWAADGKDWYVAAVDANRGVLYVVNLDGQVRTHLMESIRPTYAVPAPDGQHVAFADWTASANVWQILGL